MDSNRFDHLVRHLANGTTRRRFIHGILAGGGLAAVGVNPALAQKKGGTCKAGRIDCPSDAQKERCIYAGGGPYHRSEACPEGQSFNCGGCGPEFTCQCGFRCCEGVCQPIATCPHCECCDVTGSGLIGSCICITEEQYQAQPPRSGAGCKLR
jgi:hypothetical protein